jgi:hypothetical protein
MRSLLISSALAVTISFSAYAKTTAAHAPKAAPCVTVADLNEMLAAKGSKSSFVPVPADLYNLFVADVNLPKATVSMVAAVIAGGMIVSPLDAKGCALASATFTAARLNEMFGKSAPPAAAPKDKAPDGEDRV